MQTITANFSLARDSFCLDVDIALPSTGISAIFGRSGSGKTTLLRCIAGLESAARGELYVLGECWQGDGGFVPTHQRHVGYVFQDANLFPHLNVRDNLSYAEKRAVKREQFHCFDDVVHLLNIGHLLTQNISVLSGGEAQRVAIARALLSQPSMMLMDEPLASLDYAHKHEIFPYLEKIKLCFKQPIIYVSHSIDEISRIADHIVVLDAGKVIDSGEVTQVLSEMRFATNNSDEIVVAISGDVIELDHQWQLAKVGFDGGELWLQSREGETGLTLGQAVRLKVNAADISLTLQQPQQTSIANVLPAVITEIDMSETRAVALVRIAVGNTYLLAQLTRRSVSQLALAEGKGVWAQIKSAALMR